MFDLSGKVALVAGGSGYLGRPASKDRAEQGASVAAMRPPARLCFSRPMRQTYVTGDVLRVDGGPTAW